VYVEAGALEVHFRGVMFLAVFTSTAAVRVRGLGAAWGGWGWGRRGGSWPSHIHFLHPALVTSTTTRKPL
jgi:hypothetical protein